MKKLDLPRSYVQQGETITVLVYSCETHYGAFLDLLRSTGRGLEAEQLRGEVRRGVPPPNRGVKELDLPRSHVPQGETINALF